TGEVLRRAIKRRREAAEQYGAAGRGDRADIELAEVKALEEFLPAAVDPEEIRRAVRDAIAGGARDVGKVMGQVMPQFKGRADGAARIVAADLGRLADHAPRTAALRAAVPARELETRLAQSLDPEGRVLDGASRGVARARRAVREARHRLVERLEAILGALDPSEHAPDAAVTVRGGRYVIPVRGTAWAKVGGIVHDESATGSTLFVEPPEAIGLGNALREHEAEEQREVLQVLRDLTELLRPVRETIAAAWEMCIAFDDLCARARYAVLVNGFAPAIGTGPLEIH